MLFPRQVLGHRIRTQTKGWMMLSISRPIAVCCQIACLVPFTHPSLTPSSHIQFLVPLPFPVPSLSCRHSFSHPLPLTGATADRLAHQVGYVGKWRHSVSMGDGVPVRMHIWCFDHHRLVVDVPLVSRLLRRHRHSLSSLFLCVSSSCRRIPADQTAARPSPTDSTECSGRDT